MIEDVIELIEELTTKSMEKEKENPDWKSIVDNRKWGEISNELTQNYLDVVLNYANDMHYFYFDKVDNKRYWSIAFRGLSILFFAIALIMSLSTGFTDDDNEFWILTINVGSLVFASLLLLVDRQFGFSEGWMRYTQAQFEIEKVISDYHAQFISIQSSSGTDEQINKLRIDIITNLDKALRTIIIEETSKWSTNLKNQISALTKKVDTELSNARKQVETKRTEMETKKAEEEKAKEKGVLVIRFDYAEVESGSFEINKKDYPIKPNQDSIIVKDLNQGICIISGKLIIKNTEVSINRAATIKVGINELIISGLLK